MFWLELVWTSRNHSFADGSNIAHYAGMVPIPGIRQHTKFIAQMGCSQQLDKSPAAAFENAQPSFATKRHYLQFQLLEANLMHLLNLLSWFSLSIIKSELVNVKTSHGVSKGIHACGRSAIWQHSLALLDEMKKECLQPETCFWNAIKGVTTLHLPKYCQILQIARVYALYRGLMS